MANVYHTAQGDTIDSICYKYYGNQSGTVEVVMDHNKHLADLGIVLPIGTRIELPAITTKPRQDKRVALW